MSRNLGTKHTADIVQLILLMLTQYDASKLFSTDKVMQAANPVSIL